MISLQTAFATTIMAFLLGLMLARWRMTARKGVGLVVDSVTILPLALPPTVVGLSLLLVFGPDSPVHTFVQLLFTWPATVVASFAVSFPLMYLSARAALEQIDRSLLDLARTYGYSEWKILWRIMVPLAWPGIASGILLTFVRALGEFGATLMVAGNIPGKTQTLPLAIYFSIERGELSAGLALSGLSISISLLAIIALGLLRRRTA
jgi:molybdate transport system permease protein